MRGRLLAVALLALFALGPVRGAGANDDFASWISTDVGLCLEFRGLANHVRQFTAGPLARRLQEFPPIADALKQYRPWLAVVSAEVERRSGAKVDEIFSKLLGRHVLFAVWPPTGDEDKGAALLLIEADDRELLAQTLDRLVAARRQAGRWLGRRTLTVAGASYEADVIQPDDRHAEFYLLTLDSVGVIATSESLLADVLNRRAVAADNESPALSSLAGYQAGAAQVSDRAVAWLFINPRSWDTALAADLRTKPAGSEDARSQQFVVDVCRAMDYVVAGVEIEPRLAINLAWRWRAAALPEPARLATAGLSGPSGFIDRIPADALLAVAGRVDLVPLARHLIAADWRSSAGSNPAARAGWETIWGWALAPGWGPDFAAYCTRRSSTDSAGWPLATVISVESRPLVDGGQPLASMIEPWLTAFVAAAVEEANSRAGRSIASVESLTAGELGIKLITGLVPGRQRLALAYAVTGNCFWLATSAADLRRGVGLSGSEALSQRPAFRAQLGKLDRPSDLIYIDLARWRELLADGPEAVAFLWEGQSLDAEARARRYQTLLAISRLADRALFAAQIDDAGVSLSLSLAADDTD